MIPDWVFWLVGLFLVWKILEIVVAKYITDKVMNYITEKRIKPKDGPK